MSKDFKEKKEYKKRNDDDFGGKYDDMDDGMDEGKGRGRKFGGGRKKACRFMSGEEDINNINYKNPKFLSTFMTFSHRAIIRRCGCWASDGCGTNNIFWRPSSASIRRSTY